jgi:TetR/AcrR family transcriptional regulator of autoinduction and epiphytic fitness
MSEVKKTRSELKREAIIEGAMSAFQEFGVKDTSMDKIAEIAQVSKRTVYNHFESKEMLVAEIIQINWQKAVSKIDIVYHPQLSLEEQLSELLLAEMSLATQEGFIDLIRVAMSHFMHNECMMKEHAEKFFTEETALIKWLKAAVKAGKLKEMDVRFASELLISMLKGQAFWPQLMRHSEPLTAEERENLVKQVVDIFLTYYRA